MTLARSVSSPSSYALVISPLIFCASATSLIASPTRLTNEGALLSALVTDLCAPELFDEATKMNQLTLPLSLFSPNQLLKAWYLD